MLQENEVANGKKLTNDKNKASWFLLIIHVHHHLVNWLYYVPHSLSWKMRFFFQTAFPL
jgi:hypothetical protein